MYFPDIVSYFQARKNASSVIFLIWSRFRGPCEIIISSYSCMLDFLDFGLTSKSMILPWLRDLHVVSVSANWTLVPRSSLTKFSPKKYILSSGFSFIFIVNQSSLLKKAYRKENNYYFDGYEKCSFYTDHFHDISVRIWSRNVRKVLLFISWYNYLYSHRIIWIGLIKNLKWEVAFAFSQSGATSTKYRRFYPY